MLANGINLKKQIITAVDSIATNKTYDMHLHLQHIIHTLIAFRILVLLLISTKKTLNQK